MGWNPPVYGQNPYYSPLMETLTYLKDLAEGVVLPNAVGDNVADDTAALQTAITLAATFGLPVDLRGKTYRTTDALNLPAKTTLVNGAIRCTGVGKKILNITGSDVTLRRLSVTGRHTVATAADAEHGVYATGTSAAAPIRRLHLEQCSVTLTGMYGIHLRWVEGFRVLNSDISEVGYTGIGTLSAGNGLIEGCRIDHVLTDPVFSSDGYGVHFSRSAEITSLTTAPRSHDITMRGCTVRNVAWEGVDTHGGERVIIEGNFLLGCENGVAVVADDAEGNVPTYAAHQVVVKGNVIDSLVTDGSAGAGIVVAGAQGASAGAVAVDYATGTIVGNTIRNHGAQGDNVNAAIYLRNTRGLAIVGNHISEPSPYAINLYYDNRGFTITGNTVADAWSNTVPLAGAIACRSSNNTGTITANTLLTTGARSGTTFVNAYGLYSVGTTGTDVNLGPNFFGAAGLPVSGSGGITATFNGPVTTVDQLLGKNGTPGSPSYSFGADPDMGFYLVDVDQLGVSVGGTLRARFLATGLLLAEGMNLSVGTTTGSNIGVGATQKLGFWGATPVVQPAAVANATDAASAITQLNALLARLRSAGIVAP